MTSMPASRRARAMILAPRSWPSRPGLATTTRIFRACVLMARAPDGIRLLTDREVSRSVMFPCRDGGAGVQLGGDAAGWDTDAGQAPGDRPPGRRAAARAPPCPGAPDRADHRRARRGPRAPDRRVVGH